MATQSVMLDSATNGSAIKEKIRRVTTACDSCRSKKVRCDGPHMLDNRCSICIGLNTKCTYSRVAKKRGPPKEYVSTLESRLIEIESYLRKHHPDIDLSQELDKVDGPASRTDGGKLELYSMEANLRRCLASRDSDNREYDSDGDSSDYGSALVNAENVYDVVPFRNLNHKQAGFLGKSSHIGLFRTAMDMKYQYSGVRPPKEKETFSLAFDSRRPQYWLSGSEMQLNPPVNSKPGYDFPEPALLSCYIDVYFDEFNIYLPLLHRPSFEQSIANGVHLRDEPFGALVLMVCAVASRSQAHQKLNAGADKQGISPWFTQAQMKLRPIFGPASVNEVQIHVLTTLYVLAACAPDAPWLAVGIGIRMCQEAGAHRLKTYRMKSIYEGELWKRAFWCLFVLELLMSCCFGRQPSLREEDFDLDYPIECDDKYWSHPDPKKAFKQPAGHPSELSFFVAHLKQIRILGRILRTLYSSTKSKLLFNMIGPEKDKLIVAELDSALNKWIDDVPAHLKWDSNRPDSVFARQSGHLYIHYYHLQMLVHRPFITPARRAVSSGLPSLAISTSAARQCSKTVSIMFQNWEARASQLMLPVFTAGVVLLANIWDLKSTRQAVDIASDEEALKRCMKALKDMEDWWLPAGPLWIILNSLSSAGKMQESAFILTKLSLDDKQEASKHESNGHFNDYQLDNSSAQVLNEWAVSNNNSMHSQFCPHLFQESVFLPGSQQQYPTPASQEHTPTTSSNSNNSSPARTPSLAPPPPSATYLQNPSVFSPDLSIYNDMMMNIDNTFPITRHEGFTPMPAGNDFATMQDMGSWQSVNNTISDPSNFAYKTIGPPIAAPASLAWDEWDAYVYELMGTANLKQKGEYATV